MATEQIERMSAPEPVQDSRPAPASDIIAAPRRSLRARALPFLDWLPMHRGQIRADLLAGITVALVLVPQSMAYAQLAGMPSYYGLYAAFLPVLVGALWGSSRQLATGPVAVVSLLTASALASLAAPGSEQFIALAMMLALLVGAIQLALGLLRMGAIVNLLSHPVIIGFTNAAAIIIALSQLDKLLGVPSTRSDNFLADIGALLGRIGETHWPTLAMGIGALALMLALRRWLPRWPNVVIAAMLATLLSWLFGFGRTMELPLEAVRNEQARALVRDVLDRSAQVGRLRVQHTQRRADLEALRSQAAEVPIRLVVLESEVAILAVQVNEAINQHRAQLLALRLLDFVALDGEDGRTVLWLADAAPPERTALARHWRIDSADGRGVHLRTGGAVVGAIPAGLPTLALPRLDWSALTQLFGAALVISLVGFTEAISIAKAMAAKTRAIIDPNQELIGQGLANLTASVSQSFPVSGSFSRSAINISAGAVTGLSSVFSALVVLLTLLFLTPLLFHLPQAVLAAVIMLAVTGLINFKALLHAWRVHRHDGLAALVTFVATLAFAPHLDMGILFGVVVAIGLFLHRRMRPRAEVQAWRTGGGDDPLDQLPPDTAGGFVVLGFDGALIFVNVAYFEDAVLAALARYPGARALLLVCTGINEIDVSGAEKLNVIAERLKHADVALYLSSIKPQVMDVLQRADLGEVVAPERIYRTRAQAVLELQQRYGGAAA